MGLGTRGDSTASGGGSNVYYAQPPPPHWHSTPRLLQQWCSGCGAQCGVSAWISVPGGAARGVPAIPSSLARRWHSRATTTGLTKATSTTAMSPKFICGGEDCQGRGLGSPPPIPSVRPGHLGHLHFPRSSTPIPLWCRTPIFHGIRPRHSCGKDSIPPGAASPFPYGAGSPFSHGQHQDPHFRKG